MSKKQKQDKYSYISGKSNLFGKMVVQVPNKIKNKYKKFEKIKLKYIFLDRQFCDSDNYISEVQHKKTFNNWEDYIINLVEIQLVDQVLSSTNWFYDPVYGYSYYDIRLFLDDDKIKIDKFNDIFKIIKLKSSDRKTIKIDGDKYIELYKNIFIPISSHNKKNNWIHSDCIKAKVIYDGSVEAKNKLKPKSDYKNISDLFELYYTKRVIESLGTGPYDIDIKIKVE